MGSYRDRKSSAGNQLLCAFPTVSIQEQTCARRSLLILHGWPEFWLTWEQVTACLVDRFRLIAPVRGGFGNSEKPSGACGATYFLKH